MTREELRDYVEEQRSLNNIPYHVYSTLIDGIDALEQEPTTKNNLGVDLISRSEVLNRLASIAKIKAKSDAQKSLMGRCMFMVERIPSVTPQDIDYKAQYERLSQKAEIVISQLRTDRDRLMSLTSVTPQKPTSKNDLGVDCISRFEVTEILNSEYDIDKMLDRVDELPSVTSIRPKGHWIETAEEYYKAINEKGGGVNKDTDYFVDDIACSECLAKFSVIDNEAERFDFCPCCGSDNREVVEE